MFMIPSPYTNTVEFRTEDVEKILEKLAELQRIKEEEFKNILAFNNELNTYIMEHEETK